MTTGYLPNVFDLLNVRDLDLIAQAGMNSSELVVGVFSDDYAELVLGRRPVVPEVERMALVAHVRGVDRVVLHDETTVVDDLATRVFSVAGDVPLRYGGDTWLLTPTRETDSTLLREALAPVRANDDTLHDVA